MQYILENKYIKNMDKIQMMFNITNNNDIYYGTKKGNADGGAHQTPSGD